MWRRPGKHPDGFARHAALGGLDADVDMRRSVNSAGKPEYRFFLTRKVDGSEPRRFLASSASCPAVQAVIESLARLRPDAFAPPPLNPPPGYVLVDGIGYSLSAPSTDRLERSTITWASNVGTGLARWVDASLSSLEPCWVPTGTPK